MNATIVDEDLEAWLRGDIEKPCEVYPPPGDYQCENVAEYVMYASYRCTCNEEPVVSRYICERCRGNIETDGVTCGGEQLCHVPLLVRWIERVRR